MFCMAKNCRKCRQVEQLSVSPRSRAISRVAESCPPRPYTALARMSSPASSTRSSPAFENRRQRLALRKTKRAFLFPWPHAPRRVVDPRQSPEDERRGEGWIGRGAVRSNSPLDRVRGAEVTATNTVKWLTVWKGGSGSSSVLAPEGVVGRLPPAAYMPSYSEAMPSSFSTEDAGWSIDDVICSG